MDSSTRFCAQCGVAMKQIDRFCGQCGAPAGGEPVAAVQSSGSATTVQADSPPPAGAPKRSAGPTFIVVAIAAILLAAGIGAGIVNFFPAEQERPSGPSARRPTPGINANNRPSDSRPAQVASVDNGQGVVSPPSINGAPADNANLVDRPMAAEPSAPAKTKTAGQPHLGVAVAPTREPTELHGNGVVVVGVTPGSPADKAGLKVGDVITRINATPLEDPQGFVAAVSAAGVGETLSLEVERAGDRQQLKAVLGEYPAHQAAMDRADELFGKHDYDGAIEGYSRALELKNNIVEAYVKRGQAHQFKGQSDKAMADLDLAVAADPGSAYPYAARGGVLFVMNQLDRAIKDLTTAIELDPRYIQAYQFRGLAYQRTGDDERAMADFDKIIAIDPRYAFAYNVRGNIWYARNRLDKAIADYSKAIELDPAGPTLYFNRAVSWDRAQRTAEAMRDLSKAIELKRDYTSAYLVRGRLRMQLGQVDQAKADFQKAAEFDPSGPEGQAALTELNAIRFNEKTR